jgi:Txe/YoeB family toxin of toxin-antitoxin system
MYKLRRSARAKKDAKTCEQAGLGEQLDDILDTIEVNPYEKSQGFERLVGNLKGYCSRKIDGGNRVLYTIVPNTEKLRDENGNLYDGIALIHESWGHRYKTPKK